MNLYNLYIPSQEDDHTLIMFAPHDPSNRRRGNGRHETAQLTQDERLARHLQAEYDRELEVAVGNQTTSSMLRPRRMVPSLTEIRGRRRDLNDGNLWSSRGVGVAMATGFILTLFSLYSRRELCR